MELEPHPRNEQATITPENLMFMDINNVSLNDPLTNLLFAIEIVWYSTGHLKLGHGLKRRACILRTRFPKRPLNVLPVDTRFIYFRSLHFTEGIGPFPSRLK